MDKELLEGLYGFDCKKDYCLSRFDNLNKKHEELFGCKPDAMYSTSGRTELGGNHTDHNLGHVVAGSISLDTLASVHKTNGKTIKIISEGHAPIEFDVSKLDKIKEEEGKSISLVRGIAASFVKRNVQVSGFYANMTSSVLKGSGLSSSASYEVLLGTIFNDLFNDNKFSTTELAIIGREAENNYFGKPCGLMDQVACANGGVVGIDFKDIKNPVITPVKTDFAKWGYALVITNVRADHADLTPDYSAIPSEMRSVANYFGKENLGLMDSKLFYENISDVRKAVKNDRAIVRAHHFFTENDRAVKMIEALKKDDKDSYLALVRESGLSSYKYLQNIYSASHPDMQAIAIALTLSEHILGPDCICRVHGGGFAGTIQTYVPLDKVEKYCNEMEKVFGQGCSISLAVRNLPTLKI